MKQVAGIWLPDDDDHFGPGLETSPQIDGKATYQLAKLNLALQHVPADRRRCAYDIGAHVGLWSRVLATHFQEVEAFEPVEEFAECFELNAPGVSLHRVSLGNLNGHSLITVVPRNSGNSHVGVPRTSTSKGGGASYRVPMRRLENIEGLSPPDFIKIDVEGYEPEVLRGGEQIIRRHEPVMIVECKPGNAEHFGFGQREAVAILNAWGAKVVAEKSGDVVLKWA
jgi:FkbM family methyltransferase